MRGRRGAAIRTPTGEGDCGTRLAVEFLREFGKAPVQIGQISSAMGTNGANKGRARKMGFECAGSFIDPTTNIYQASPDLDPLLPHLRSKLELNSATHTHIHI